jgi:uncharacterized glyoxalase superfamily protein PhnB
MFDRFSERARKTMVLARQEARRFNHDYIGTEHILLGLIQEGSGVAAQVLRNLEVDSRKIRDDVEQIVKKGARPVPMGQLPFTPRGKKVLEHSLEEAQKLGHNYIGTEHLLLGLVHENEGIAAQVLLRLGTKLERVREEVVELVGESPGAGPAAPAGPRFAGRAIPMLPMRDAKETAAFYARLGFHVELDLSREGTHGVARRGDVVVHFFHRPDVAPANNYSRCYLSVEDADALHAEFVAAGIEGLAAIEDAPWGMREFHVRDPNGNLLRIGHRRR